MVRRSILSAARDEKPPLTTEQPPTFSEDIAAKPTIKPSRRAKLHIGGYYSPDDASIVAFQKLGIDLRCSQQDMLLEAIRDFVAKHEAFRAFR